MKELILDAINGREFDLAVRYCGIAEGQRGDREHHQPCPFCEGKDRFWFRHEKKIFQCRQCGFWGDIITLLRATNGLTFPQALETLARETGVLLPKEEKRTRRFGVKTAYERNENDARMLIASLVLVYIRSTPGTDCTDFREASIETVREYASRFTSYRFDEIVELLAISRCGRDRAKALLVLECLYTCKNISRELQAYNIDREIQKIRTLVVKERYQLQREVDREIETLTTKDCSP